METDAPSQKMQETGGHAGQSDGNTIAIVFGALAVLGVPSCLFAFWKYLARRCWEYLARRWRCCQGDTSDPKEKSNERKAIEGVSNSLLNNTSNQGARNPGAGASGSEGNVTVVDQSPNHQGEINRSSQGCDDKAAETEMEASPSAIPAAGNVCRPSFYDIYLVSTVKETPHVQKIKNICQRNGWTFTTPFDGKLGAPVMKTIEDAVLSCTHVVLIVTKEDCPMTDGEYSLTYEMAMATVEKGQSIGGKVIPILCCQREYLRPRLKCLTWSAIEDKDLEKRMIDTIDKSIRERREAGASAFGDGSDMTDGDGYMPDLK